MPLVFRFILPLATMLLLAGAAIAIAADDRSGAWMVATVVFLNIAIGTQNA